MVVSHNIGEPHRMTMRRILTEESIDQAAFPLPEASFEGMYHRLREEVARLGKEPVEWVLSVACVVKESRDEPSDEDYTGSS